MTLKPSFFLTVAGISILSAAAFAQEAPSAAESAAAVAVEAPTLPVENSTTEPAPAETAPVVATEAPVPAETPAPATTDVPSDAPAPAEAVSTPITETEKKDAEIDASRQDKVTVPLPALSKDSPVEKAILDQLLIRKPPVDIEKMPSLFLTVWERDLIINARKGQLTRDPDAPIEDIAAPDPLNPYEGPRDIRLSGIVYRSSNDWVIWLNAKRISPKALLPEIMDIKVYKDYIELEWFDPGTNQIFPIRLRPHQRFNMDARVFLPG